MNILPNSWQTKLQSRKKRLVIVNDVRIYLNSVKKIVSTINDAGIPAQIKQEVDGDDVIVTLRMKKYQKAEYCQK